MPLYEYQCFDCRNNFTELRGFSEIDKQIDCPQCASYSTERVISSFALGGSIKKTNTNCIPLSSKFT